MKTPDLPDNNVGMSGNSWSVNYLLLLANNEVEPNKLMLEYVADFLATMIDFVGELKLENNELKSRLAQVERENTKA